MLLGESDILSWLPVTADELGEMPFFNKLFDGNFELEAVLGIMSMVLVVHTHTFL